MINIQYTHSHTPVKTFLIINIELQHQRKSLPLSCCIGLISLGLTPLLYLISNVHLEHVQNPNCFIKLISNIMNKTEIKMASKNMLFNKSELDFAFTISTTHT